ncbi:MAG: hypothetical protein JOZ62_18595 [Acidobacteriaceae bacterium]|nr:hypothetical protein [Acidobacteriaceae bacterium]
MAQAQAYELLYDSYFPFRLYADFRRGLTLDELAKEYSMPARWIEERLEAARLCVEKQIRIELLSEGEAVH